MALTESHLFATNVLHDARVCFLAGKCAGCDNNEIDAAEVEYCIASGFVRVQRRGDGRTWITHINNVAISYEPGPPDGPAA